MRQAPPVRVRGSGGWPWRALCAALPAFSVGVLLFWLQQQLALAAGATALFVAAVAAVACALLLWRRPPPAQDLAWDGRAWTADGTPGRLQVMLDLGPWLLLRLQPEAVPPARRGRARWVPLAAAEAGAHWAALRAAVYSRASPGAQPTAPPSTPPATPARRPPEHPAD